MSKRDDEVSLCDENDMLDLNNQDARKRKLALIPPNSSDSNTIKQATSV